MNGTGPLVTDADLRQNADWMTQAERIAHFGVWSWKLDTNEVRWSAELHRIYGIEPGQFAGTLEGFARYLHPDDRERVLEQIQRAVSTREQFVFEERIIRADGQERVLLSQGRPLIGPDGEVASLVGVCHDVTDRVEAHRALGQSERRMRAILDNSPSMIAVKDLEGIYVMSNVETGKTLGLHADDMIGHECVEFFPTVADQLRANDRRAIAELEPVFDEAVLELDGEQRTYLTVTFALTDDQGRPAEVCTIATDVTERKEREQERRERLEWQERIGAALAGDRLLVYGQPIISLDSDTRASCELLVRMRESGTANGVLLPAAFLPHAERFGLIQSIDVWMVRQALRLNLPVHTTVNLSAVTLCDPAARAEIIELLAGHPNAAASIVLEITETADAKHLDAACEFAAQLTDLGCGLALDDFGTGFGSFTYLHKLPLRYLKVDVAFVKRMIDSAEDRRVVQTIIGIARQFELKVIAEGVEGRETLDLLREFGADYAQGFYLGRPEPVDTVSLRP
jgi:PAS domain S-box-containing protein